MTDRDVLAVDDLGPRLQRSLNQERDAPQAVSIGVTVIASLLAVYVILRAIAWSNTVLLEDHDSILYLQQIDAYRTFDPTVIYSLSPDSTPFYPFFGALLSSLAGTSVLGARLCSLLFSVALFFAAYGILRRTTSALASALGLVILAVSPYLITFSISILSEPAYVGVAYVGILYFIAKYRSPSLWHAAGLGLVFGISFLNRMEGLLFLALIPLLQFAHWCCLRGFRAAIRPSAPWILVFVLVYTFVAAPQVLIVSSKMGQFALNGREVWADLLLAPGETSYDQRIYGLDHSESKINLHFLQENPSAIDRAESGFSIVHTAEIVLRNVDKLYSVQIGRLGGSLLVTLFLLGLLDLVRKNRRYEAFVILCCLAAFILPGLLTDPKPRAVASMVPLLAMYSGAGILFAARELTPSRSPKWLGYILPGALLLVLIVVWTAPLLGIVLQRKMENSEYSLTELEPVRAIISESVRRDPARRHAVASRKQYLTYLADLPFVPLPYTDMEGLLRYCRSNEITYLFLEYQLIDGFPFVDELAQSGPPPEFERIYATTNVDGDRFELYRVK